MSDSSAKNELQPSWASLVAWTLTVKTTFHTATVLSATLLHTQGSTLITVYKWSSPRFLVSSLIQMLLRSTFSPPKCRGLKTLLNFTSYSHCVWSQNKGYKISSLYSYSFFVLENVNSICKLPPFHRDPRISRLTCERHLPSSREGVRWSSLPENAL